MEYIDLENLRRIPYGIRVTIIFIYVFISSSLLYSQRHHAGKKSTIALAVVISIINFIVPVLFDPVSEILAVSITGLSIMWLCTFKQLGFAMGRGPLADPRLNLAQFIATTGLPITPVLSPPNKETLRGNSRLHETGYSAFGSFINLLAKISILTPIVVVLQLHTPPQIVRELLYSIGLYSFISVVMNIVGCFTIAFLSMPIAKNFDSPFLSTSLSDFWSRRWNLNTGYTLRFLIYDPICEGHWVKKKERRSTRSSTKAAWNISPQRRALAVCASMFVSGVMHEIFIIYLRNRVSGYWLLFFTIQGPLLVLESLSKRMKRTNLNWNVPNSVAIPCTVCFLLWLGNLLFFPDIEKMGIPRQVVDSLYKMLPDIVSMSQVL